jgi:peptidoglycan hydrolase-like protein with peptidoglycan-binding domain
VIYFTEQESILLMKKIIIGILFTVLFIPQSVFAVWWNPTTWFGKKQPLSGKQMEIMPATPVEVSKTAPSPIKTDAASAITTAQVATQNPVVEASSTTKSSEPKGTGMNSSCIVLTKELSKGAQGDEVRYLQQFLSDKGYLNGKPNGTFGDGTFTSLKKFQFDNGISMTGSLSQATREAIKSISCTGKSMGSSNPFEAVFIRQNEAMAQAIPQTCTKSTPAKMSVALKKYIVEVNQKIDSLNAMSYELSQDSRYTSQMTDALEQAKTSHNETKKCEEDYSKLVSYLQDTSTFTNDTCAMAKSCMNKVLEETKAAQKYTLLLYDALTPSERSELLGSINSSIR